MRTSTRRLAPRKAFAAEGRAGAALTASASPPPAAPAAGGAAAATPATGAQSAAPADRVDDDAHGGDAERRAAADDESQPPTSRGDGSLAFTAVRDFYDFESEDDEWAEYRGRRSQEDSAAGDRIAAHDGCDGVRAGAGLQKVQGAEGEVVLGSKSGDDPRRRRGRPGECAVVVRA